MANIPVTPSASYTVAADDIAGVEYQYVKLDIGAAGTATPVGTANPVPVALGGALPAVVTSGFPGAAVPGLVVWNADVDITTATPAVAASGQVVWIANPQPGVSTTGASGVAGEIVWLGVGQTINIDLDPYETTAKPAAASTGMVVWQQDFNVTAATPAANASGQVVWVVPGVSVNALITGAVSISAMPTVVVSGMAGQSVSAQVSGAVSISAMPSVAISTNLLTTATPGAAASGLMVWCANPNTASLTVTAAADAARTMLNIIVSSTVIGVSGTTVLMTVYQSAAQTVAGVANWVVPGGKTFRIVGANLIASNSITTTPVLVRAMVLQSGATPTWTSAVPIAAQVGVWIPNATFPSGVNIAGLQQDIGAGVTVAVAYTAASSTASVQGMWIYGYLFP